MIRTLTYEQIDRTAWTERIRSSKTGTWFQSPEVYDFFASMPEQFEPFVIGVASNLLSFQGRVGDRLSLRGICVGYITKERNPLRQFFTRRAIILGGPCLADDATDDEVETLMRAIVYSVRCKVYSPIYVETRNFNDYSQWRTAFEKAGFAYKQHLNFHVNTQDFEARLSDNRRRQIGKAKNLVICELANDESDIREWYAVLSELYRTKVRTPLLPMHFFLEAYRQKIAQFLLVKYDGHVIGGSMLVSLCGVVYEWFECGLNTRYKDQYPSVMATYSGIRYAQEHGCERYDMMGAGEPNKPYGVRDFKAEFGGTLVEHGRFLCVCHPLLYRFGVFIVRILKHL